MLKPILIPTTVFHGIFVATLRSSFRPLWHNFPRMKDNGIELFSNGGTTKLVLSNLWNIKIGLMMQLSGLA
jgi:hypothetical protein